ncbi:MAG: sigma-70 family RNA polymerase sigma factor [archaeon]
MPKPKPPQKIGRVNPDEINAEREPLRHYYSQIKGHRIPEAEEIKQWARQYRASPNTPKGLEARNNIIQHNLRYSHSIGQRYYRLIRNLNARTTTADLIQASNEGLVKAATKYDPERGATFLTYATHYMRGHVLREIIKSFIIKKPPFYIIKMLEKEIAEIENYESKGRKPTKEAFKTLQKKKERLDIIQRANRILDIDAPLREGEELSLHDRVSKTGASEMRDQIEIALFRNKLTRALGMLNENERKVIEMRIIDPQKKTFEAIGKRMGFSKQGAQQLFEHAVAKLSVRPELRGPLQRIMFGDRRRKTSKIKRPNETQIKLLRDAMERIGFSGIRKRVIQLRFLEPKPLSIREIALQCRSYPNQIGLLLRKIKIQLNDPSLDNLFAMDY